MMAEFSSSFFFINNLFNHKTVVDFFTSKDIDALKTTIIIIFDFIPEYIYYKLLRTYKTSFGFEYYNI